MRRQVSANLQLDVTAPALLVLQLAVATHPAQERLTLTTADGLLPVREVVGPHGSRVHVVEAPVGPLVVQYSATVDGALPVPDGGEADRLVHMRPSRYCPSDRLLATAAAEFGHLTDPAAVVAAVRAWVARRLVYVRGASRPTDDAVDTLLQGEGVCRDYAHLVTALLRARNIPARVAAVYAPGLTPMDFHAVAEAYTGGTWQAVDATGLAPRGAMLRVATGRDTSDTAFVSVHGGLADLTGVTVDAVADVLPPDDGTGLVPLS
ncbi:transglutaminase [Pseudonocardia sp. CNS-139]|nr:transglutaminase [Pseudonocardia sp. CNS-139]